MWFPISRVSKRSPWLVYNHSMVLKKGLFSLCHPRASLGSNWALKVVRQVGRPVSLHEISFCVLLLLCSCSCSLLSRSVHREKYPNLSTVPWFHSVCTSDSMFTINTDNCLSLFLFLLLFLCTYGGSLCTYRGFILFEKN